MKETPHPTTIVWFRRELRVSDHAALWHAAELGRVVPVYVHDARRDGAWSPGGASRWWLDRSLRAFAASLEDLGSRLVIRAGDAAEQIAAIASETGADRVFFTEAIEPDAQALDDEIEHRLGRDGITVDRFHPNLIWEVGSVLTKEGRPSQVFSPFWRAGLKTGEPDEPIDAPRSLAPPETAPGSLTIDDLGLQPTIPWAGGLEDRWVPGEEGAQNLFDDFLAERIDDYKIDRDRMDVPGWSAMSPHIHFGEISVRQIWHAVAGSCDRWDNEPNREHYLRELGWREFAQHLLNHFPHTPERPLRDKFARFPWREDPDQLRAWKTGMTGYPIVDAAMRNLYAEGWMPNRARMIVASFLCKHLRLSWEHGAAWFWDTLADADLGSNTLGWQWAAGCGADAAPYFRIFNPITQGEKFDPLGDYVRRWIPEIADLDTRVIHKPWEAAPMELASLGIVLGETYPEPIVDHKAARESALEAFETIKG